MPDVTIVGGGIAGLVVARRLALAGRAVRLREASQHLGGTVARHTVAGISLDAGAESFAVRGGAVAALAAELGLETVTPAIAGAWLQPAAGAARPLPATAVLGIPGTPLAADVIAIVGLRGAWRAELDALMPVFRISADETLGGLVRKRMGRRVLERLVAPVVHGVHSLDPAQLPIERAIPDLRARLLRDGSLAAAVRSLRAASPAGSAVAGIHGGMHRLVAALVSDLERLGVEIRLGDRVDLSEPLDATVIIAAPLSPGGRKVTLATLVVDAPELDAAPRGTGVLVAAGADGIRARALTHATAKWAWLRDAAEGRHVLRLSYDREPVDLAETARADAAALLGVDLAPSAVLGFARVEWIRPALVAPPPGVTVVGETVAGSGLAGIIAQANAASEEFLAD
jgi:oxygen-dependent protoporphyrinogen oxidase